MSEGADECPELTLQMGVGQLKGAKRGGAYSKRMWKPPVLPLVFLLLMNNSDVGQTEDKAAVLWPQGPQDRDSGHVLGL